MKTLYSIALLILTITPFPNKGFATSLTDTEKKGIQLMREEEKLAHDVYQFLYKKWELPIFGNISRSEARHIDAVGILVDQYGLNDPVINEPGQFQNKELQELYKTLTKKGTKSLIAALEVGAFIEEVDIKDLQHLISQTSNERIKMVYGNLLRASGNHLRAFIGQLESRDISYNPVVLTQEEYQEIINTPHQQGIGYGGRNRFREKIN
jgi:hypothetical protein